MVVELSKEHEGEIHLRSGKINWDIYSPKFDLKKGFEYLLRAAECENPEGMYLVGFAYLHGNRGVEKDVEKAYEWLAKAASAGNGEAQMLVAEKADEDADIEAAIHWYGEAEKQNVFLANEKKRIMLIKKHNSNPSDTFEWHKEGADLGIAFECYNVGVMYYRGTAIQPNYQLAADYLEKALHEDAVHSQEIALTLGDIYANKLFDPMKAAEYYDILLNKEFREKKISMLRSSLGFLSRIKFERQYTDFLRKIQIDKERQLKELNDN